ncbi:MAG: BLUF domain-containing protein [Hydrogenophaga sp.]
MSLHEIIYVSLASQEMSEAELAHLLEDSRIRNLAQGISGMMIYHRREFMQLLEGEQSTIFAVYDRIVRDPRHQQIYKLWDGPIAQRNFEHWEMAYVSPDGLDLAQHEGYRPFFDKGLVASTEDSTGKKILLNMRDDLLQLKC